MTGSLALTTLLTHTRARAALSGLMPPIPEVQPTFGKRKVR
jgi:hypothetical protein